MSKATPRHTPGPWRHTKGGYVYAADCVVAKVGDFADTELLPFNRRWLADSDLIAAAPEMLEALKSAASYFEWYGGEATLDQVRAAIAKAEGRKP